MSTQQIRRLAAATIFFLIALHLIPGKLLAQDAPVSTTAKAEQTSFSLQEAIDYGLKNSVTVQNSQLDILSAKAKVGEIRAIGLPQINFQGNITDNVKIPTSFLPAVFFDKNAASDAPPIPVQFGVQYVGSGTINANQLLFDASYFLGLKAAATYNQLSQKGLTQSKISVVEAITKAYYSVLVSQERLTLLDYNVKRLDTLLQQTKLQNENGFVEKIDVDRIEVQYNNLKVDYGRTVRLVELGRALLKFQMGYNPNANIELTDKLVAQNVENIQIEDNSKFNYGQRIEYSLLQTQKELNWLDIRNNKVGYYPHLSAFGSFGYNRGSNEFDLFNKAWFANGSIGLNLTIPIFDGLSKHYKNQQAKLTYQKTTQSAKQLEQSIDLQLQQARISLENSLDVLKTQRRNLELAERVAKVTRIKYAQGVGSNIEVINAEAGFKEAQTNYYSALYDALVAKVDSDKAAGKLYTE
ncbi:MAG: TolC family protein [Bacteroidota bacterium]